MSARLVDALLDCRAAMEAAGVPGAVRGGLAMAVHGFERATRDIRLLIMAGEHLSAVAPARRTPVAESPASPSDSPFSHAAPPTR